MSAVLLAPDILGPVLPSSWGEVARVIFVSVAVYAFVIASHRLVGNRAASQMNNFDWIVTVAMGAITGSTILSQGVSLVEGLLAVATLLGLQYAVTRAAVRWPSFRRAVQVGPRLLYYEGVALKDAMKEERIMESEILRAARDAGNRSLSEVAAVVLEADGTLSVIPVPEDGVGSAAPPVLSDVHGLPDYLPPIDDPAALDTDDPVSDGSDSDGSDSDSSGGAGSSNGSPGRSGSGGEDSGTPHKQDG